MGKPDRTDVLLAVAEAAATRPATGDAVCSVLAGNGVAPRPDAVLAQLLHLEDGGLVAIDRGAGWTVRLTTAGEATVGEVGGGAVVERALVMVDLVGFVSFTAGHGDGAARDAVAGLLGSAEVALARQGGRIVKSTGDGFLGAAPAHADLVTSVREVAAATRAPAGGPWPMRAAVHTGRPIEHRGDLFGHDVNLVARLCDAAREGEVVRALEDATAGSEALAVRGLAAPVHVERLSL